MFSANLPRRPRPFDFYFRKISRKNYFQCKNYRIISLNIVPILCRILAALAVPSSHHSMARAKCAHSTDISYPISNDPNNIVKLNNWDNLTLFLFFLETTKKLFFDIFVFFVMDSISDRIF